MEAETKSDEGRPLDLNPWQKLQKEFDLLTKRVEEILHKLLGSSNFDETAVGFLRGQLQKFEMEGYHRGFTSGRNIKVAEELDEAAKQHTEQLDHLNTKIAQQHNEIVHLGEML